MTRARGRGRACLVRIKKMQEEEIVNRKIIVVGIIRNERLDLWTNG